MNGELGATQELLAAERQLRGILEQEMQELQEAAAPLQSYFLKVCSAALLMIKSRDVRWICVQQDPLASEYGSWCIAEYLGP